MASVTQKIPNYVLGISTQPDERKLPGQVVDLVNGVPDVVRQLIKRPGSSLITAISPSTASHTKWFNIYSKDDEQYIGQVGADGAVKIWRCSDGTEISVDYADIAGTNKATYLDNTSLTDEASSDIQINTINETTFFVNRRKVTALLDTAPDKSPAQLNEAFISLDTISYGKQYALDIYDPSDNTTYSHTRATSVTIDETTSYSGTSNGDCLGMGRETVNLSSGRGIGATSPPTVAALTGTYVRSGTTVTATVTNHGYQVGESVTIDFTSGAATDGTFLVTSAADANTFTITHGDSGTVSTSNLSIPRGRTNLRYEVDTRCQPQPTGTVDDSYTYHDSYQPFAKLQFGGEGWTTGDQHQYTSAKGVTTTVTVKSHVDINSRANVAMVRPSATSSTADEHVSSAGILGDIKTSLDAISGHGITCTIVGNGIHLYRATPFGVTTPEQQLMTVTTTEANNIADLPRTCRHGYTVRIVNSGEDMDDYYLRFQAEGIAADIVQTATYARSGSTITVTSTAHGLSNGSEVILDFTSGGATDGYYTITSVADANTFTVTDSASGTIASGSTVTIHPARFGEGVWEEVAAPGITTTLDNDTMPLALTRVVPSTQYIVTTSLVNTSNEQITLTNHGLVTGHTVLYSNGGGTTLAGLTNDTVYYVIKASDNTIALASSLSNANAGVAVNLTGTGNNSQTLTHGYFAINGAANTHHPNGAFRFSYPDWGKRDVGDDITNAPPSFVGYTIQGLQFFRNRIALLSEENIILSRVNDFYNFWVKTAMAISNADPIDLQSSSTFPTKIYSAVESAGGLVLFSASEQFLLSAGAEALLTPETAKISYLSSYAFNDTTVPISLGTSIGFLNSTARQSRFYEMQAVSTREEPEVQELSKIVGKLFPENITNVTGSTENKLLLFSVDSTLHTATNEVWGYKWYISGDDRPQSAWFRWTLPNNVVFQTMMDDKYYVVLNTGSTYTFERFDIKLATDTDMIGTSPNENRVHLDTKKSIATADLTYNDATDVTTFTLGAGYYSSRTLTVYCTDAGNSAGKSYDVPTAKITGTAPNESVELSGNWKYEKHTFPHTDVDTTAETLTISGHGTSTGDAVIYKQPTTTGSSSVAGLSDGSTYYIIKVDANTVKLATSSSNATAGTAINLTGTGSGTHTLQKHTGLIVGYEYEFEVELPKIYVLRPEGDRMRSETRGSLVVHRMNFEFGDVGVIDVTLKRKGRDDYTYTVESLEWDNITSSSAAIADGYVHTIPVYDRNTNLNVFIKSNHPSPATVHSMNWEGDYSPRYYSRV